MLDSLLSLLTVTAIALAAYGVGSPVARGLRLEGEDLLGALTWKLGLGLVAAGTGLAALGLAGVLYAPLVGALTLGACFWGAGELLCELARRYDAARARPMREPDEAEAPAEPLAPPPRWLARGVLGLAGAACLGSLIAALAPPTAGDALCYHLELPKTFLLDHRLGFLPDQENCTYPLLTEMWYLWALALDGAVAAQLVHWGLGVLLAMATATLAAGRLGRRWAAVAGALVLLVPGVNNQMTAPLNDLALAALSTLALAGWCRAVLDDAGRPWFAAAGLAAGGALGTKYLAIVFALAMAIPWARAVWRQRDRRGHLLQGAAIVTIVALSVGGPWYLRAAHYRGNPVYPFFAEVLSPEQGQAGKPGVRAAAAFETLPGSKSPLGRGAWGLVTSPWQVTLRPERFGGRGHQLGVLLLAALPGLVLARRLRGLGTLLAVAASYWVLWFLLRQNVRFLLPAVPILSVAVVWVWIEMRRLPAVPRAVAGSAFAMALTVCAGAALVRCRAQVPVALGRESREAYLRGHEPTWEAASVAGQVLGPKSRLLSQEHRAFYFPCRVTRENAYRRRTGYPHQLGGPGELSATLRQAGFTHVLLAENEAGAGLDYDPTLRRLVDSQLSVEHNSLIPLANYRFRDSDGALRHYRLLMLR